MITAEMNDLLGPILEFERARGDDEARSWRRRPGTRVDLHCHSTFSRERIKWLPGIGYRPLLEPEEVYDLAKSRGMDFVTLTDHDTIDGCLALVERRGGRADFFFGEEVSAAFPEDGTIIHINVYDHDEWQHDEIQRRRDNIYELLDYLHAIDKLFVFNHPTWTQQHRILRPHQIEMLLERCPVIEALNGTRSYSHNAFAWYATRGRNKVLVAGSDSHTHRVGTTYTLSQGSTTAELIANIRAGRTAICGAFGTPEKLREDVWLTLHKNAERRMTETTSYTYRAACRVVEGLGRAVSPLVCLGYHSRQNDLIRDFARAWAHLFEPPPSAAAAGGGE